MYDIVIIGAGPAGLTAAVYARRAEKSVVILEKGTFGGQITFSPCVENFPGFKSLSGNELADLMVDQALSLGAEIELYEANGVKVNSDGTKTVTTAEGEEFTAQAVIIATGAKHRLLGVEGEKELIGHGISFCAVCDGAFYKGKETVVVGGGNSALQEALLLSDGCKKVTLVQNLDTFTGEEKLLSALRAKDNVEFITGARVDSFTESNGELTGINITVKDESETLYTDGVFIAIGLAPDNGNFKDCARLNEWGYFDTDEKCLTETPGVFVAGDCRSKAIRQITTAAADGSVSALAACNYIDRL